MFVRKRLPGFWIPGSVVDPLEFEYIDRDIADALDSNGGTYALAAALVLGGAGLSLSGTTHEVAAGGRLSVASTGEVRVLSGGLIRVQAGGAVDVYGAMNVKTSANITVESGGTVALSSGSTLTAVAGSTVSLTGSTLVRGAMVVRKSGGPGTLNIEDDCTLTVEAHAPFDIYSNLTKVQSGGQVSFLDGSFLVSEDGATATWLGTWTFANDTWPQLAPARAWTRSSFDIISVYGEGTPLMYWGLSPATNGPCVATALATTTGKSSILRLLDLPVGGTLTSVVVTSQGFQGASTPTQVPTYRLVSWGDTSAAGLTNLSSVVTDAHAGGNWLSTALDNTITASGSGFVIDPALNYGVLITHPYDGSPGTQGIFYRADSTGTVSAIEL